MTQNNLETIVLKSIGKSFSCDDNNNSFLDGVNIGDWTDKQTAKAFKGLSKEDAELIDSTFKMDFYDLVSRSKK